MKELLLHYQRTHEIDDELIYKKAAIKQQIFIRDTICLNLLNCHAFVVSRHMSKSVFLPVYGFTMPNGIKIICRGNFYDWKISVKLPIPVEMDIIPMDLITDGYHNNIPDVYCEGFKDEWVYPAYKSGSLNFTIETHNEYKFYTIMYYLKHAYDDVQSEERPAMTQEEIAEEIERIYREYGAYEMIPSKGGWSEEREAMSKWEIFFMTHFALDNYEFKEKHKIEKSLFSITDNAMEFAEWIVKYDDIYEKFINELREYNCEY